MLNADIRNFEEQLVTLYNNSNAPAEAKRLVLLTVLHQAEKVSQSAIQAELKELKNKESEVTESE